MSTILICHTAHDEKAAKTLGSELHRFGHDVSFETNFTYWRSNAGGISRKYVAVIVLWTEASVTSESLCELAREVLRTNRLIPVRAESLSIDRIPSEFSRLDTPPLADLTVISQAIVRKSSRRSMNWDRVEGSWKQTTGKVKEKWGKLTDDAITQIGGQRDQLVGKIQEAYGVSSDEADRQVRDWEMVGRNHETENLATAPPPTLSPRGHATAGTRKGSRENEALKVEAGRLVHKIPQRMWLGERETVEIRLGRKATKGLTRELSGRGLLREESVPIVESMTVSLHSREGEFEIQPQSEATQLVIKDKVKGTPFEASKFGRWLWHVTPHALGKHPLVVRVSAALRDSRGVPTHTSLPDTQVVVTVNVHAGRSLVKLARWGVPTLVGAVGVAFLDAATHDYWWPKVKAILHTWGWIG
jgi:uncharacterized protein YjbJ (UPF0337 family)